MKQFPLQKTWKLAEQLLYNKGQKGHIQMEGEAEMWVHQNPTLGTMTHSQEGLSQI